MSLLHDEQNRITAEISKNLNENIDTISALFSDCADVTKRKITVGNTNKVDVYIVYVDNMINKGLLEEVTLQQLFTNLTDLPGEGQFDYIKEKGLRTVDVAEVITMNALIENVLSGDTVILVDGYDKAIKVSIRGMPNRGVPTSENEVAIRGSKESFSEAFYINRVLLRRRIKDTNFKTQTIENRYQKPYGYSYLLSGRCGKTGIVGEIEKRLKRICNRWNL
jgi:Bacillus/Clostridium GerA spore germination protein.